ncbi:hypothetical protein ACEN2J_13985 [Pseudorhodobacter sp. W20_MBD10_FR17]|uniref:hypothetical protein n=1 Tax=Pseudorhodobacter sp. W20_MBD10_FR17 TaxID=3240266 RepID=UPI003F97F32C
MIFWPIVSLIYIAVTVFAVYMTYQEQRRQGRSSPMYNLIGYLLCTVWPVLVAAFLVMARFGPDAGLAAKQD